jgi:hypothetical protein
VTHAEFVAAYRAGKLSVRVDPKAAAQLVTREMMLPLILLPVLGVAVALALAGHFVAGALLFAAALAFRFLVRKSSPGFLVKRALESEDFYFQALGAGLLKVEHPA